MERWSPFAGWVLLAAVLPVCGCQSPYHADRGALLGGLGGAGVGAIVGNAVGNTGAGAAIGAAAGALTGAAIGSGMDEVEAKNRAMIEARMGRQVRAGAVTMDDVIAMSQARVDDELIVNHIRAHGVAAPLQARDLIFLQQQGVSARVIRTMQEPPPAAAQPVVVTQPQPVIVEQWGPPVYVGPPCRPHYWHRPPPRAGWGISVHGH